MKLLKSPQAAEDATQEVFFKVFQKIGELKDPQAFPAWFKRITVNQCTYTLKKDSNILVAEEDISELEFIEENDDRLLPEKSLDNAETARLITEVVDALPMPQKACIYCYYYEQLSVADIAECLAVSENTVKTRLSLAREKIRKGLKKLEEKDGVKLYSVAPFVIPALLQTMSETQVPVHLFGKISAELGLTVAASATTAVMALKTKLLIGMGGVAVVGGIITGVVLYDSDDDFSGEIYNPVTIADVTSAITTASVEPLTTFVETTLLSESTVYTATYSTAETTDLTLETTSTTPENTDIENITTTITSTPHTTTAPQQTTQPLPTTPITLVTEPPQTNPYAGLRVDETLQFGGHSWRVLDAHAGKALIVSAEILTLRQYHSNRNEVATWENSDIRGWLNGAFYNDTFSSDEKRFIAQTQLETANNRWHGTFGGNATLDKIFLLSLEEVVRYFGDSGQLGGGSQNVPINDEFNTARTAIYGGSNRWWWTRSPGNGSNRAANINNNGFLDLRGDTVDNNNGGIRPALWLDLN